MEREIKFRAKVQGTGAWFFGLPYSVYGIEIDSMIHGIIENSEYIASETLGQFTGLKDKNWKEIYDGDIIEFVFSYYSETEIQVIKKGKIVKTNLAFMFETKEESYYLTDLTFDSESDIEIIGNIYDNPELLE